MNTMTRTTMAKAMRKARESRGITQAELAEMAGIPSSAVSHFEGARRLPSLPNAVALADALAITIDELIGRDGVR